MASAFKTDESGIELIETFEGYAKRQIINGEWTGKYVSYKPTRVSNWTIGGGQEHALYPGTPGEIKVDENTVITHDQAYNALRFFVAQVVDPLVSKHFNPRTQAEHNALASWVYNIRHDRLEKNGYSLPDKVNAYNRDTGALISKWLEYCQTPGAENGLYKRRIAELLMFLGLPWNTPAVWGYVRSAIYKRKDGTVDPTPFDFVLAIAEQAAAVAPVIPVEEEPLPELPPAHTTPNIDPALPPKPMEESKTHKGLSKAESGRETVGIGVVLAGLGTLLPQLQVITTFLQNVPTIVILKALLLVGLGVAVIGAWRWWSGKMIAYEGRANAVQPKV